VEAGDEGQRRYEEETNPKRQTTAGLTTAINTAMDVKRAKLLTSFIKFLTIANPCNGSQFLEEVSTSHIS
jgi:hypothetical protein